MYPPGYQTWIAVEEISAPLEGECRPGHFRGVATVVAKLFNAFLPDKAYFGQKDAQQVAVLRRMVQDLNFPVELVVCPTVREPDGLAMSSRNAYLNPAERQAATVLYRSLAAAREAFEKGESERGGFAGNHERGCRIRAAGLCAICIRGGSGYAWSSCFRLKTASCYRWPCG